MNQKIFYSYLEFFNHPYKDQKYLHIAGTKGKTSTSYYLYQMLLDSDKAVGLFVSPHIFTEKERIQRNGQMISSEDISEYRKQIAQAKSIINDSLGFFEEFLLIAFLFFRDNPVEYVILEVGIGGLLDTTNIITPSLSIITRIKKDHQEILGKTLWGMCRQKLGIIKPMKPFLIGKQNLMVSFYIFLLTFFRRKDLVHRVKLKVYSIKEREMNLQIDGRNLILEGPYYMVENFLISYTALKFLGIKWTKDRFIHRVPGRMQPIEGFSFAFLDGAHNEIAVKVLIKTLLFQFPKRKWKIILCIRQDKSFPLMVNLLKDISEIFIFCAWDKEVKVDYHPAPILEYLEKKRISYRYIAKENLNTLLKKDDNILVTGSFYHLAPVYYELRKKFA